jgi:hypothetical protein
MINNARKCFESDKNPRFAKSLFAGRAAVLFLLILGSASPIQADTFPVSGTVGFETGLHNIAFVTLSKSVGATIDWGDGGSSPGLLRCFEPILHPRQCHVFGTHVYAAEGAYTVTILYKSPGLFGSNQTETTSATISPVEEFVILSIGDSAASGEGSPVVRFGGLVGSQPNKGFWDDPGSNYDSPTPATTEQAERAAPCHRTRLAGPALAGQRIASTNPITFIHFACSGAVVKQIPKNVSFLLRQLEVARLHLERIDVLLISVGANNMKFRKKDLFGNFTGEIGLGFGAVITRCLVPFSPCSEDDDFTADVSDSIEGNPGRTETDNNGSVHAFPGLQSLYADLDKAINCIDPANDNPLGNCSDEQIPKLVLITEYFDPTHDENGEFPGVLCPDAGIKKKEWQYLHDGIMARLNHHVRLSPWPAVVGIENDFLRHGYCSNDRWVVRAGESLIRQGDPSGTAHPNEAGQQAYDARIHASLIALNPPVTQASATAAGQQYDFGTWTAEDVEVTLAARNPISESGVGQTYFAVNDPACTPPVVTSCSIYAGPFVIVDSGVHTIRFFSENQSGAFESVASVVVRIDKDPPRMACAGTPPVLWPPNGKMVPVTTTVEAVDDVSGLVPFVLASVGASEANAPADIQGFMVGEPDTGGSMRARRSGFGPGREYTLTYEAAEELGNTGSCTIVITVPHDRRRARS